MPTAEQKDNPEKKEPMTKLRLISVGMIARLNPYPKNIQLALESLDQYEIPKDESVDSLEIQRLYGNVIATGESRWEKMTGKRYADRDPLSDIEKDAFYRKATP